MKINFLHLVSGILSFLLAFALLMLMVALSGCSAEYHLTKFHKKGGKIDVTDTTIYVTDTIRINGKDSIIYRPIDVKCPDVTYPEPRYVTRWKYKVKIDSIKVEKWKTKYVYKTIKAEKKAEVKTNPWRNLRAIIFWAVLVVIGLFTFNWISKR